MLRSFQVANHKSIKAEQELQLMPVHDKTQPVVPVAAIYGANASGKSNLLDALRFMRQAVRESFRVWESETGIPRSPYALDISGRVDPSSYVAELVLDGVEHLYGFILDDERVLEEWLYSYPRKKKRVVFERKGMDVSLGSTIPEQASKIDLISKLLQENSLVLSAAGQVTALPEADPVNHWFRTRLMFADNSRLTRGEVSAKRVQAALAQHPGFLDLVRAADMGVTGIRVENVAESPDELTQTGLLAAAQAVDERDGTLNEARLLQELGTPKVRARLVFFHGEASLPMSAKDQSDGTLAWLGLLPLTLDALSAGRVLIVDELDSSLHPRLIARLVELFHDKRTNPKRAQLIFTTHDATLLGTSFGREILGRDEIWFVDKDRDNQSKLVALTDFRPRKEDNRERRYLAGSYGGVPAVFSDTFVEAMLATRPEKRDAEA